MMKYEKPVVELVSFQAEEKIMAVSDIRLEIEGRDDLLGVAALSYTHTFAS